MAERIFERRKVGQGGSGTLAPRFAEMQADGYRLEAISMTGLHPRGTWVALTWIRDDGGPEQRLGGVVPAYDGLVDQVHDMRMSGFAPALATAAYDDVATVFALTIYERVPSDARSWPDFIWKPSFGSFGATAEAAVHTHHLRSAFILEAAPLSDRPGLFIGVLWPYGDEAFDWGVTYWYSTSLADGFIEHSPRAKAMALAARPWIVVPSVALVPAVEPHRPKAEFLRRFLVVWRDRFFTPWPGPTHAPFDRAAHRELEITIDFVELPQLDEVRADREARNYKLLSWAGRGPGAASSHYALNWINKSDELQRRTFIMTGPGNIENGVDSSAFTVVGANDDSEVVDPVMRPWLEARRIGLAHPLADPRLQGRGRPLHPFDEVMRDWMVKYGVRAAQLCVNRHGESRYSRAYTWAEDGYPVTKTYHRMRIGSVSKVLTALPLMRHYLRLSSNGPPGAELDRKLADELHISGATDDAAFKAVTVRQALAHRTGMDPYDISDEEIIEVLRPEDLPEDDVDGVPLGPPLPLPGEMRQALAAWPRPLVTLPVGDHSYNNYVFIALAELWSGLEMDRWDLYGLALTRAMADAAINIDLFVSGLGYGACKARNEVAYHPHFLAIRRWPLDGPYAWALSPYAYDTPFWAGTGGCALSMRELGRILALLTPRSRTTPFLEPEEKWIMSGRHSPGVTDWVLGWDTASVGSFYWLRDDGTTDHVEKRIKSTKSGNVAGDLTWAVHECPGPESGAAAELTLDIACSFNTDRGAGDNPIVLLGVAAQAVEYQELWAPVDLTNGSEFDEDEP